jgi:uncharacterized damage-inducible protein DinB
VQALGSIAGQLGLDLAAPSKCAAVPGEIESIVYAYQAAMSRLKDEISAWDVAALDQAVAIYGMLWTRRATVRVLMDHEIHHRGGLVVLMRQAGLGPPSLYGPAGEAPHEG